jgi:hypothetical protein
MCLSVRFASSVAAAWSAGVAEHRFESQRNSRNVLSSSFETTPQRSARFSGEYSYIYIASKIELENWIYMRERERERERRRLFVPARFEKIQHDDKTLFYPLRGGGSGRRR